MRAHFLRALIAVLFFSLIGVGACIVRSYPPGHRHYAAQGHGRPKKHKPVKHKKHKKHKNHH